MIKFENTEVLGWEHAIRGMRNPYSIEGAENNSWEKGDSKWSYVNPENVDECICVDHFGDSEFWIGPNDQDLMMRLTKGGPVHAKYRRMIAVYVDITAPLYWWKEFDTYKVGTVANSCSTMHKITAKEFTLEDFSCEHLDIRISADGTVYSPTEVLGDVIACLNTARDAYLETKEMGISKLVKKVGFNVWNAIPEDSDEAKRNNLAKKYWWQMIQLLPTSYNQKRTVMLNYEVLAGIYPSRKDHRLDEWHVFCDWIKSLPYSEIIVGDQSEERTAKMYEKALRMSKALEKLKCPDLKDIPTEEMRGNRAKITVIDDFADIPKENSQAEKTKEVGEALLEGMKKGIDPAERNNDVSKAMKDIMDKLNADGATTEDISKEMQIEHLVDVTCSWQVEELGGRRLYMLAPGCTRNELTPYERTLLACSEAYERNRQEKERKNRKKKKNKRKK